MVVSIKRSDLFSIVFVVMIFVELLSCKSNNFSNNSVYNQDYVNYTRLINVGQKNVLNEKYQEAFDSYLKAFTSVEKPLPKHYYTAIQLAITLKRTDKTKELMTVGMQKGISPKMFYSDSLINGFIRENHLNSFVEDTYIKGKIIYEKSINKFLFDTIAKLSKEDNKWKVHYMDSLCQVDSVHKELYKEKYNVIVADLVENKLIPLIKKHGFPNERQIGVHGFDNEYDNSVFGLYNNSANLILLHYFSAPRSCQYNNLLLNEVHKGNLNPENYASIIDFQAQWGNNKYCKVFYYNQWHITLDTTLFEKINMERAKIGLEPFQELELKKKRGLEICKRKKEGKYNHIKLFHWCG